VHLSPFFQRRQRNLDERSLVVTSTRYPTEQQLPDGVAQVLNIIQSSLGSSVAGVYLFGSSVIGGLRPHSDLDILVAVEQPLSEATRWMMVADLMKISGGGANGGLARPVEVTVVNLSDVVPWRYPPRNELVYGEWLRAEFEANRIPSPAFDPDLAVVLTKVSNNSLAMLGPGARELFDPIPIEDLHRAIAESLPTLICGLRGDERNVLLTLARMWVTLATNEIVSKDVAAQWVLDRLPPEHGAVLDLARRAYLGECSDDWAHREKEVDAFVRYAKQAINACLQNPHRVEDEP
jgi:aminoglycoside 9-adenylyltransferase